MQESDSRQKIRRAGRNGTNGWRHLGRALLRCWLYVVTQLACRPRIHPSEQPLPDACLLISNLASCWDPLLLARAIGRPLTVVLHPDWAARVPRCCLGGLLRIVAMPFDAPLDTLERHLKDELQRGQVVCVFAEGMPGWNGHMRGFHPWFERLGGIAPVFPVHIGPPLAASTGCSRLRWLVQRPVVTLQVGAAMPGTPAAWQVRQAVAALSCNLYTLLYGGQTLPGAFLRCARRNWFRLAVHDTTGKSLSYGRLLAASIALRDQLWPQIRDASVVGILLPASVGGVVANTAVTLSGRIAVNINFTLARAQMDATIQQCCPACILSSRTFLDKLGLRLDASANVICLEDLVARMGPGIRVRALLQAWFASEQRLAGGRAVKAGDTATILFSSGSTGDPKGVMLRHKNLLANIWQIQQVFPYAKTDRLCGILPFFHSFGLTVTMWAVLLSGASASYHPNPLEGERIGALVRQRQLTLLLATPGFMRGWLRRVEADAFCSLRALIAGAEHLPAALCDAFEQRFGIRPQEGYGITELSPVVSVNVADRVLYGHTHVGTRAGTVGHPLPGIALRVRDPESGRLLPPGMDGVLEVKGPNVMRGYLDRPADTTAALQQGWYRTGDVVAIDADGWITIRDRLSRFSKIGGEMVPHEAVERVLEAHLACEERVVAVVAVPDARRGERLVVCYTPPAGDARTLHGLVRASSLPHLWKPRRVDFVQMDEMPVLGSGKVDLGRLKQVAETYMMNRPGTVSRAAERLRDSL